MIQVIYILRNDSNTIGNYNTDKILYPNESIVLDNSPSDYSGNLILSIQQKIINEDKILNLLPRKYSN
jgi:AAA15 family ATPase/GTPase